MRLAGRSNPRTNELPFTKHYKYIYNLCSHGTDILLLAGLKGSKVINHFQNLILTVPSLTFTFPKTEQL